MIGQLLGLGWTLAAWFFIASFFIAPVVVQYRKTRKDPR